MLTAIELNKRYYQWAKAQSEFESESHYALIKGLHTPIGIRFLNILQSFPPPERQSTWSALLKRFHPIGSTAAGEGLSEEDRFIINRYDQLITLSFAMDYISSSSGAIVPKREILSSACAAIEHKLKVRVQTKNNLHSRPTDLKEKCWIESFALPQGRDEKENNQTNTRQVQHIAPSMQSDSSLHGFEDCQGDWGRG